MASWQFALVIALIVLFLLSWVIYLSVRISRLKTIIRKLEDAESGDNGYSETGDAEGRG